MRRGGPCLPRVLDCMHVLRGSRRNEQSHGPLWLAACDLPPVLSFCYHNGHKLASHPLAPILLQRERNQPAEVPGARRLCAAHPAAAVGRPFVLPRSPCQQRSHRCHRPAAPIASHEQQHCQPAWWSGKGSGRRCAGSPGSRGSTAYAAGTAGRAAGLAHGSALGVGGSGGWRPGRERRPGQGRPSAEQVSRLPCIALTAWTLHAI